MARPIFSWRPNSNSQASVKPLVNATKFGDGYEQRVPSGINTQAEKWSLTFERDMIEGTAILDFLKARNATEAFDWLTPYSKTFAFVCREWKSTANGGTITITTDFEQVFES